MPRILLISQKRCGTNWLMELIGALPKTICFRDVFNPGGAFGLKPGRNAAAAAIAEHLDLPILEERDPDLIDFVRTEPELFLRFVEAAIQRKGCCWCGATIFDGHLSPQQFRSVISAKGTLVVLLKRRNLDRAISLKKARLTGAWKGLDTSEIRPEVTWQDVDNAIQESKSWFDFVEDCLQVNEIPFVELRYEDHVLEGPEHVLLHLASHTSNFPWAEGEPVPIPSIQAQDLTRDVFERISNGAELKKALQEHGIFGEAMNYPGRISRSISSMVGRG